MNWQLRSLVGAGCVIFLGAGCATLRETDGRAAGRLTPFLRQIPIQPQPQADRPWRECVYREEDIIDKLQRLAELEALRRSDVLGNLDEDIIDDEVATHPSLTDHFDFAAYFASRQAFCKALEEQISKLEKQIAPFAGAINESPPTK